MKLLVVTPTLGRSPWLAEVMRDVEVLSRTVPLVQVLVAPGSVVAALQKDYPRATVVDEEREGGLYGAINRGADAVSGWRWLTYINDDDRLEPALADVWTLVVKMNPAPDVVFGNVDYIDEHGRTIAPFPVSRWPADIPGLLAAGVAPFTQQGSLIGADVWRRLGGFDESFRLAGDFDFWVRAAAAGARFKFVARKVARFRVRAGQLSRATESTAEEILGALKQSPLRVSAPKRMRGMIRFRLANLPRIIVRIARTRRLRSRTLLQE